MMTMINPFLPIDTNQCSTRATLVPGPNDAADNTRNPFQNITNVSKAANKPSDNIPKLGAPNNAAVSHCPKMTTSVAVRTPSTKYPFRNVVRVSDESCETPFYETMLESPPSPVDNSDAVQEIEAKYVSEYALDLHNAFRKQELLSSISPSYQSRQPHLTDENRAMLVNWMVSLQTSFRFSNATLHLAVSLLDRFLDATLLVELEQLQLVGATCFWIASKYEERHLPMDGLVRACDGLYRRQEFLLMETRILATLRCRVSLPTADTFLDLFLAVAKLDNVTRNLAHYLLDGALTSYQLLRYRPSQLAAAAFLLACHSTGKNVVADENLANRTGYQQVALLPVASAILEARENRRSHEVEIKYQSSCPDLPVVRNLGLQPTR